MSGLADEAAPLLLPFQLFTGKAQKKIYAEKKLTAFHGNSINVAALLPLTAQADAIFSATQLFLVRRWPQTLGGTCCPLDKPQAGT